MLLPGNMGFQSEFHWMERG